MRRAACLLALLLAPSVARAHPLSFGVFDVREAEDHSLTIDLRFSGDEDSPAAIAAQLPSECAVTRITQIEIPYGVRIVGRARCQGSLVGKSIGVRGLESAETQVLLELRLADGREESTLLTSDAPVYRIPAREAITNVLATYVELGVTHILEGVDHLMLVLGLILLVRGTRRVVLTITAFTVGHSVTLALATLDFVHVPAPPAEACIALSLVLLAAELLREDAESLGRRAPWLLAVTFGLLHGLGFAGALAEIGVPERALTLALFGFNLGVELGQLLFVAIAAFVGLAAARALPVARLTFAKERLLPVCLGASATYFLLDRFTTLGS
jgi:hydrogenase/urease accessory protein HupE